MNFNKLLISCRLITVVHKAISIPKVYTKHTVYREFHATNARNMAQRSITSFFKVSPPKNDAANNEKKEHEGETTENKINSEKSPVVNGIEKKTSKRARLESSESETEVAKSPKLASQKTKKPKRQRIESSESESGLSKSDDPQSPLPENLPIKEEETDSPEKPKTSPQKEEKLLKLEKSSKPKTYESPKTKKRKFNTLSQVKKSTSPSKNNLKQSSSVSKDSPKKSVAKESPERSPSPKNKVKQELSNGDVESVDKNKENVKVNIEAEKKDEAGDKILVSEMDYNPAKAKYHPIEDACWRAGQPVPYLALTQTLEIIEGTSARLKIVDILANYFRSVITLTPEDLLPSVYMCLNKLAPAYHGVELGIAETFLMKAVGQCTGQSVSQTRAAARRAGSLAAAAASARSAQRLMFAARPLTARGVFKALKEIAAMTGQSSMNKKISKIQTLFVACRQSEAKFLIRSLEGKLRIGLAEQSVLQALAVAAALTPPGPQGVTVLDASRGLAPDALKSRIDEHALLIKTTYCECPNYDLLIPTLLAAGVGALPERCRLTVGIPLKPMLAHPTKGVDEIFNRFEGTEFTCEWKYDGERAQIHVPAGSDGRPDLRAATIYSRNQEDNTSKYPDILRRLPSLLKDTVTSCVLDCEAVAYDTENKQILPFQVLSTRKRKGAVEAEIKVQVCVFVFDVLLLNGEPLVRDELRTRRDKLREHFNQVPGEWQFATSRDCSSMEEVQLFLEEAVRGSCEGLMVKALAGAAARYDIARRSHNWLKLKKDYIDGVGDTIDVVIIGAYSGKGRRSGVYGGFLAAARDPGTDSYQALCKLGTGFTDADLQTLSEDLNKHLIDGPRSYYSAAGQAIVHPAGVSQYVSGIRVGLARLVPAPRIAGGMAARHKPGGIVAGTVWNSPNPRFDSSHAAEAWFAAACVWEVRCADLSLSPAHRAAIGLVDPDRGISLRFPRFVRTRPDKTPEQATTAHQIAEMYLAQDQVKNQTNKPRVNMDDFY